MAATKASDFDKVLSAWDILVIAFGAMIGWGWVVSTGDWIMQGGVVGAMLGFVIGGVMVFFVGLTYAELTSAMPQCGGEHVFSFKAMGPIGSFVCTWAIVLGYVSVVCFEACALPTIVTYIYPDFLQGYLYSVEGFDIYASWLAMAVLVAAFITYINIIGTKTAAILQTILTVIIGGVGILLIAASIFSGQADNLDNQLFMGATTTDMLKGTLAVAVMTPFFFIGFDVIPQAAEEISVSLKKIGRILILSIILAVAFYALIIFGVGYVMNNTAIANAMKGVGGLVTADAMATAFGSTIMAKVLIIGGLCGIITSWNSFLIGGSRAMYSMAESYMIPHVFAKLHKKYKSPVNALLLIGLLSVIAPFFGKKMLVWVVDAGNFGCCAAYCMVAVSFIILRSKAPDMPRPYRVGHYKLVGTMAVLMSGFMVAMYIIPGSGAALVPQEWAMVLGWSVLGLGFGVFCKARYGEKFATHVDVALEPQTETARDLAFGQAMADALKEVQSEGAVTYAERPLKFSFFMPSNMIFGSHTCRKAGRLVKAYGEQALFVTDSTAKRIADTWETITDSFDQAKITYTVFAHGDNKTQQVMIQNGLAQLQQMQGDMVVAVGGNDAIVSAKQIVYAAEKEWKKHIPLVIIPATYDVEEAFHGVVMWKDDTGNEQAVYRPSANAAAVLVDPACMKSMRKKEIALAGFAAICRTINAYTAHTAQPLADAMALYGLSLLQDHLVSVYTDTASEQDWEKVVLGSIISCMVGYGTGNVLLCGMKKAAALVHMAYEDVLPAVYPLLLDLACKQDIFRYGKIARTLGGFTANDCTTRLLDIEKQLQLDVRTADLGLAEEDIARMAKIYLAYSAQTTDTTAEAALHVQTEMI